MASQSQPLPSTRRIVTGHSPSAKAIVARDSLIHGNQTGHGPWIQLFWSSEALPPDPNTKEDLGKVNTGLSNGGTIVRMVDFPPHSVGMVHRSVTLDYIYVVEGEVVLTLDDGSRTVIKKGEIVVQQATMHGWDNETDQWARLLCVLIAAKPPLIGEVTLESEVPFQI